MKKRFAIFLDRDGTLNEDKGYTYRIEDFKILPYVFEGLRKLSDLGFSFFVITNQSGVRRGYYTERDVLRFHAYMKEVIYENTGVIIEDFYFCPHLPEDNCKCRKPNTFFLEEIYKRFRFNKRYSFVIGDKLSDVEMAHRFGLYGILVLTGEGRKSVLKIKQKGIYPDFIALNLLEAAYFIEGILKYGT